MKTFTRVLVVTFLFILTARPSYIVQAPSGPIFAQTQTVTIANSVTETTLVGLGTGSVTLPANFFTVGKTITLRMWGFHSTVSNANITINVKLGGATVATTGAAASGNATNATFELQSMITCRTTGAGGTAFTQGYYDEYHVNGAKVGLTNTGTNAINTTIPLTLDVTATWGTMSASDTISATNFNISQ